MLLIKSFEVRKRGNGFAEFCSWLNTQCFTRGLGAPWHGLRKKV